MVINYPPDLLVGTFRSVSSPGAAKHRARWGDPRVTHSRKGSALQAVGNSRHFLESFYFPGKMIASAHGDWHADEKHRTGAYSGGRTRGRQGPRIVLADVYMGMTSAGLCSGFSQNHRYRNTSILEFISKNSSYTHAPTHPASSTEALPVISERWKQDDH